MRGSKNHHLRLSYGKFYVVVRQGDRDIKVFAGTNVLEARQTRDDLLRELGLWKLTRAERRAMVKQREEAEAAQEQPRLPRRSFDYYTTGCVTLLAAVHATREAYEWALDSFPAARAHDARRVGA